MPRKAKVSKAPPEVVYICDGKVKGCNKASCYYRLDANGQRGACMHTSSSFNAKYGTCNPKDYPERFDKYRSGDKVRYYEKERHI